MIMTLKGLTVREQEIAKYVATGQTNWEIARILRVSVNTIKYDLKQINKKLNLENRYQLAAIVLEEKYIK